MKFSSESASIYANWEGFQDIESGIEEYVASVYINNVMKETFILDGMTTNIEDHTLHFQHGDNVYVSDFQAYKYL